MQDYFLNGQAHGEMAGALAMDNGMGVSFDSGLFRPYLANRKSDGRAVPVCTLDTGRVENVEDKDGNVVINSETGLPKTKPVLEVVEVKDIRDAGIDNPVLNSTTLRKDTWLRFDTRVQQTLRKRLQAYASLAAGNTYGGFDGMGVEILEYETLTDDGEALVDMDGTSMGRNDESIYQLEGIPLPLTHSSFSFSHRKINIAQRGGTPLQLTRAAHAARRIAEKIEQTLIGTVTGIKHGGTGSYGLAPQVYGYTNHPHRMLKTDLTPSAGITGAQFLANVQSMITTAMNSNFYGPYVVYVSTNYDRQLGNDYKDESDKTIRQRVLELDQVASVQRLDYLTGDQIVIVQMDPEVVEAINGMAPRVIQWQSQGMMVRNFKVVTIQVPWVKTFVGDVTGIVHGTTS